MFENYKQLDDAGKASVKAIHKAIRAEVEHRAGALAWAFVRGFPYRRVERSHRMTEMDAGTHYGSPAYADQPYVLVEGRWYYEHNMPSAGAITHVLGTHIPGFAEIDKQRPWLTKAHPDVVAWLKNREGAISAPAPRPKKVFVRPEVPQVA